MKYENLEKLSEDQFRRITGMPKESFGKMVGVLEAAEAVRREKGGPKRKLTLENMLLATLEYLTEYRTYAHIAVGFGVSESQIYRIIKWVEKTLVSDGHLTLPGRRAKYNNLIDASGANSTRLE